MDQKCDRLNPPAPLQNTDLEQRLEKKLNNVSSFNNHINNINELITYFKDRTINQKRDIKIMKL